MRSLAFRRSVQVFLPGILALAAAWPSGASAAPSSPVRIGMLPTEVRQIMGAPASIDRFSFSGEEIWNYGKSTLTFRVGKVDEFFDPERRFGIRLEAGSRSQGQPDWLNLGSLRGDVLAVLGTPDGVRRYPYIDEEIWLYGSSSVTLKKGSMIGFISGNRDLKLRIAADFTGQANRQTPIKLQKGSPISDVLLIMGTPTAVSTHPYSGQVIWEFPKGKVYTYNGKVEGIVNPKVPAKAQVVPSGVVIPHPNLRWGGLYYASGKWLPVREEEERFSVAAGGSAVPEVAEDGSRRGELDIWGREKTIYVTGYFRPNGTYVKSHWRSRHLPAASASLTERMLLEPASSKGRGAAVPAGARGSRR